MLWQLAAINLWSPSHIIGWSAIIALALLLGMVHGITPDEHTWPITFSYAIGGYSTKSGLRAGLIFSLAFTIQRAIASELAYLGLSHFYNSPIINYVIYLAVGILMFVAGVFIVRRKSILHFDLPLFKSHQSGDKSDSGPWLNDPRPWMPAVHGFVAGWGFGAFALIVYTVLAPATHSAALGWVPGAVFGVGTMIVQVIAGGLFGLIAVRRGLSPQAVRKVALKTAGNTLTWGGLAFVVGGALGLVSPTIASLSIPTGIRIHNLDSIGLALVLVMISVIGVGLTTLLVETRAEFRKIKTVK